MSQNNPKAAVDKMVFVITLIVVVLAILTYIYSEVIAGNNSIMTLAAMFTSLEFAFTVIINTLFILFTSMATAVFLHYLFFELNMRWFYKKETRDKIEGDLRKALKDRNEATLDNVKSKLEGDMTFFAESLRRLSIDHFSSYDTLMAFFRSIVEEEFVRVRRNMALINLASVQGPALGFLGTAVGMVSCFYEIALKQFVTPGDLAKSIQFALITTVLGLIIKTTCSLYNAIVTRMVLNREEFLLAKFDEIFVQQ